MSDFYTSLVGRLCAYKTTPHPVDPVYRQAEIVAVYLGNSGRVGVELLIRDTETPEVLERAATAVKVSPVQNPPQI